jgi:hypothetical protein
MSVALRGNLEDFGIADVFQLIGQQRKTGILELHGGGGDVELRFDRGAVVSASPVRTPPDAALGEMLVRCGLLEPGQLAALRRESEAAAQRVPALAVEREWISAEQLQEIEDLLTRETFFSVLRWRSGAFDFRAQPVEHSRPMEALLGAEQILMDGLRMLDEWQGIGSSVPSEQVIFEPVGDFAAWRAEAGAHATALGAAERVYALLDGRSDVRRVIDRSRLGTFDAVRALAELERAGLVAVVADRAPEPCAASEPLASPTPRRLRTLGATLAPMALLLFAAVAALLGRGAGAPPPGFPILRSPIAELRGEQAARELRHAVEALRFETGDWPLSLDALADPSAPMAAAGGRPYYYALRSDGAVLLAPER